MIAVGPPSYAPLAFLKLSLAVPYLKDYGFFATSPVVIVIVQTIALIVAIAVIGMAVFFLLMAALAIAVSAPKMTFHLTWYGLIFPNVGFLSTVGLLGTLLPSEGIWWFTSVCTALLCGLWICINVAHARSFIKSTKGM